MPNQTGGAVRYPLLNIKRPGARRTPEFTRYHHNRGLIFSQEFITKIEHCYPAQDVNALSVVEISVYAL